MKIKAAWLNITRACNLRCDWCYALEQLAKCQNMDLEYAKELADHLKSKGINTIILIGGEPTLYANLFELIAYLKSIGMAVEMATNGKRFSDPQFTRKIVEAGIDGINISIKGVNESEYQANTHSSGFEQMVAGYRNLATLGVEPTISYVITSSDEEGFDAFVEMLKNEKLNDLVIQFEKPALSMDEEVKAMDMRDMGKFCGYIFSSMEKSGINYTIEVSFPLCLIDKDVLEDMIEKGRISTCCHVQKGTGIVFDVDGKVVPCNHFMGYPFADEALDPKDPDAIEALMKTEIAKQFKNTVNRYPTSRCEVCDKWPICGGGCFIRWFYSDPSDYIGNEV